jgi:hypothetical protein
LKLNKKKVAFLLIKITVSTALLVYIFKKAGIREVVSHLQTMNIWLFGCSSLIYLFIMMISSVRWKLLLAQYHPITKIFSLYMIGTFFNTILPGAVGGDAVKAYYLYKDTGKGGSSIGSVFLDRYIGFFALLSMGTLSGIFAFRDLCKIRMQWVIPMLFALFIVGSLIFFRLRIGERFSAVSDFYDYFHNAIGNRASIVKAYLLSLLIQTLTIFSVYILAAGIGQPLTFTALFVFVPIIIVITMIPLSISGLGIRESAFVALFGLTGVSPEASMSISFLWFLSIASASLLGLIEYVRYRKRPVVMTPAPRQQPL